MPFRKKILSSTFLKISFKKCKIVSFHENFGMTPKKLKKQVFNMTFPQPVEKLKTFCFFCRKLDKIVAKGDF